MRNSRIRSSILPVAAAIAGVSLFCAATEKGQSQTVPNVGTITSGILSPPAIPIPGTTLSQGLTWTFGQWAVGFQEKKDVLSFFNLTADGNSAVRLTTDGTTAKASNVGSIPNGTAVEYNAQCVVIDRTSKAANTYTFGPSAISNIGGTVAASGTNPAVTTGPVLGGGLTLVATMSITADNVFKGWNITFTPPAAGSNPVYSSCTLELLVIN